MIEINLDREIIFCFRAFSMWKEVLVAGNRSQGYKEMLNSVLLLEQMGEKMVR